MAFRLREVRHAQRARLLRRATVSKQRNVKLFQIPSLAIWIQTVNATSDTMEIKDRLNARSAKLVIRMLLLQIRVSLEALPTLLLVPATLGITEAG